MVGRVHPGVLGRVVGGGGGVEIGEHLSSKEYDIIQ